MLDCVIFKEKKKNVSVECKLLWAIPLATSALGARFSLLLSGGYSSSSSLLGILPFSNPFRSRLSRFVFTPMMGTPPCGELYFISVLDVM